MGVGVAAPVIVAALVNRNVPVKVIDAVDDQGSMSFVSLARCAQGRSRALITATLSFPLTSAATIRGAPMSTATITATMGGWSARGTGF